MSCISPIVLWEEEGLGAIRRQASLPHVAPVSLCFGCVFPPGFPGIGDVLNMYMADHTGASSGSGRPCFVRLADDLTSLACGVTLARSDFAMDVSKPSWPFGREGFGMS